MGKLFRKDDQEPREELSFSQQLASLPQVVQQRFMKQMAASLVILLLTLILAAYFRSWEYSVGLLISLYFAYMGFDIVWSHSSGKLVCKRVLCVKASKVLGSSEQLQTIMRDVDAEVGAEDSMYHFSISTSKTNAAMITEGTLLDVYYRVDRPAELIAWNIIGNASVDSN